MRWWLKAAIQQTTGYMPLGGHVHRWLQLPFGELAEISKSTRFGNATMLIEMARKYAGPLADQRIVELGTGWVPAVPLSFLLVGARVDSYDISPLVCHETFLPCLRELARRLPALAKSAGIALDEVQLRYKKIEHAPTFQAAAQKLGGDYRAPRDTRRLPYRDGEVDLVISNLVLSCIPPFILKDVIPESARILKPGGYSIHRVNTQDEFSGCDSRRGPVDYLRYSRAAWDLFCNNPNHHINRLRYPQFMELFERAGLRTLWVNKVTEHDAIPRLKQLGVDSEFRRFSWEDLCTVNFAVALQKPATNGHKHIFPSLPLTRETNGVRALQPA